ncbi:MAG: hypothetical protein K6E90_00670, partial [Lachnospiraceae bacterium]|nr:hypothetical protein [Lachnospiraceae bacterium]
VVTVSVPNRKRPRNILLFSYTSSVIVKGIERKLAEDYAVSSTVGDASALSAKASLTGLIIIYLPQNIGEDVLGIQEIKAVLESAEQNDTGVILIGEAELKEKLGSKLPLEGGCRWVSRPVDIAYLGKVVKEMFA